MRKILVTYSIDGRNTLDTIELELPKNASEQTIEEIAKKAVLCEVFNDLDWSWDEIP